MAINAKGMIPITIVNPSHLSIFSERDMHNTPHDIGCPFSIYLVVNVKTLQVYLLLW
jgi:hypothetical protein